MGLWADCGWGMQRREGPAQLVHDGADALISIRHSVVLEVRVQGRGRINYHSQKPNS